ncbi:YggS family pyridoxal phosphate-dependent enzyme [Hydrogenivirga caldilitoris]|nr:YggS family pyridoxal phosphate-dependent enzyme [Hydrogenivirga caldilitoris]
MHECERLKSIMKLIEKACNRVGRDPEEVTLLGASKTVPPERIRAFYGCGLRTFGENRVQEFLKKYEALAGLTIDWHFIGRLQTNKVKHLVGKVSLIHSLDRVSLAEEIQKRAQKADLVQRVLIEVNMGGEETKGGVSPKEVFGLFTHIQNLPNLKVEGLMTIPPYRENQEEVRPFFRGLRELKEELEHRFGVRLKHLSMGMSHDFEVAIEEGATIVRIGTMLFGERN